MLADGQALVAELCRHEATVKVLLIAVSGYGQDGDRARSAGAGIGQHLVTPVAIEILQRVLTEVAEAAESAAKG